MEIPLELVAFIAIVLGIIGRTYFPFLKKTDVTPGTGSVAIMTFDYKFILTAIFSGLVTAIFIYPTFVFPANATIITVFISGFITAWGANDVINRIAH